MAAKPADAAEHDAAQCHRLVFEQIAGSVDILGQPRRRIAEQRGIGPAIFVGTHEHGIAAGHLGTQRGDGCRQGFAIRLCRIEGRDLQFAEIDDRRFDPVAISALRQLRRGADKAPVCRADTAASGHEEKFDQDGQALPRRRPTSGRLPAKGRVAASMDEWISDMGSSCFRWFRQGRSDARRLTPNSLPCKR